MTQRFQSKSHCHSDLGLDIDACCDDNDYTTDRNHDGDDNDCERVFRTKLFVLLIIIILIEMQFDADII